MSLDEISAGLAGDSGVAASGVAAGDLGAEGGAAVGSAPVSAASTVKGDAQLIHPMTSRARCRAFAQRERQVERESRDCSIMVTRHFLRRSGNAMRGALAARHSSHKNYPRLAAIRPRKIAK